MGNFSPNDSKCTNKVSGKPSVSTKIFLFIAFENYFLFQNDFLREFMIGETYTMATIILALTYIGKITFEKGKERYRKYKNKVQQINTVSASVPEPQIQAVPQIQLNNAAHNPKIISTLALFVSLFIFLTIAITVLVNVYLQTFEITRLLILGVHRAFGCLALPLFFYATNPSMRQFINELYFNL